MPPWRWCHPPDAASPSRRPPPSPPCRHPPLPPPPCVPPCKATADPQAHHRLTGAGSGSGRCPPRAGVAVRDARRSRDGDPPTPRPPLFPPAPAAPAARGTILAASEPDPRHTLAGGSQWDSGEGRGLCIPSVTGFHPMRMGRRLGCWSGAGGGLAMMGVEAAGDHSTCDSWVGTTISSNLRAQLDPRQVAPRTCCTASQVALLKNSKNSRERPVGGTCMGRPLCLWLQQPWRRQNGRALWSLRGQPGAAA